MENEKIEEKIGWNTKKKLSQVALHLKKAHDQAVDKQKRKRAYQKRIMDNAVTRFKLYILYAGNNSPMRRRVSSFYPVTNHALISSSTYGKHG